MSKQTKEQTDFKKYLPWLVGINIVLIMAIVASQNKTVKKYIVEVDDVPKKGEDTQTTEVIKNNTVKIKEVSEIKKMTEEEVKKSLIDKRNEERKAYFARAIREERQKSYKAYVNFTKEARMTPLVVENYKMREVEPKKYPGVTIVDAISLDKQVKVVTMHSESQLDTDGQELAAQMLLNIKAEELEPVKNPGLYNANLEKIQVFEYDDENPIYAVKARIKGRAQGGHVFIGVVGDGKRVGEDLDKIKANFSKIEVGK